MSLAAALLAGALSAPAQAQDLVYQWPQGETLHYQIQGFVHAPRVLRFWASENYDARVVEYQTLLLLECEVLEVSKNVDLSCGVHRAQFGGQAWPDEQGKLNMIFAEFGRVLEDATVQVVLKPSGRVKTVDLEGVDKDNDRDAKLHEDLRLLMQRALAGLEVEMPKDAAGAEPWRQKGSPLLMRLPTRYGTSGGMRLEHEIAERDGDVVQISSWGQATVSSLVDAQVTEGMSTQSSDLSDTGDVNMFVSGGAQFDAARGVLIQSEFQVQGALTAASSGVGSGVYIDQFFMVDLLENFDEVDARIAAAEAAAEGNDVDQDAQDAIQELFNKPNDPAEAEEDEDAPDEATRDAERPSEDAPEGEEPPAEEATRDAERPMEDAEGDE